MHVLLLALATSLTAVPAYATNHVLVLSGGNDPSANHYSQFLQTRLLSEELKNILAPNEVSVMFGAGNNEVTPNIMADVNRKVTEGTETYLKMEFGAIPGNVSATKSNVLAFLDSTDIARLSSSDTFFLFVSDHGMPNKNNNTFAQ